MPAKSSGLLLGLVTVTFVAGTVGAALAPYLAVHHPLLLIALNPWPRHLVLVAARVDVRAFVAISSLRAFFSCVLGYEVGVRYGAAGLAHFRRRFVRLARWLRAFRGAFVRAAVLWLTLLPWPLTAALAGMNSVRRMHALPALLLGEILWALALYRIGFAMAPFTQLIIDFLRTHVVETTLASAALVVAYQLWARNRRLRALRERG